jgi:phosphatidylglycerophosphate synthase
MEIPAAVRAADAKGLIITEPLAVAVVGTNPTPIWGMDIAERTRRIAAANKLGWAAGPLPDGPALLVAAAFVFDPPWLKHFAVRPGEGLTLGGRPVIVHTRDAAETAAVAAAMAGEGAVPAGLNLIAHEDGATIVNDQLRKREQPFAMPLDADTVRAAERASYFGAYKGVTDVLTKYLWPEWALVLTRLAARFGITPNMVTAVGAFLCVAATFLFWDGRYWAGMAVGLGFMVLDTVDGKLARCTITSSKWGNVFDHGIDLIHPPFWWWAWAVGLAAYGTPISSQTFWWLMAVIQGGYVLQRVIEGVFMRRFGMHIHVWRKFDSDFRLITARRNPNMVILFASMLVQRPDLGLIAVAAWTAISLAVHAVQLIQAYTARARGRAIVSWLA